jgi:hypothetical protein
MRYTLLPISVTAFAFASPCAHLSKSKDVITPQVRCMCALISPCSRMHTRVCTPACVRASERACERACVLVRVHTS